MFPFKGTLLLALIVALAPRLFAMPECGVCGNPSSINRLAGRTLNGTGEKKILYIRVNYPDDLTDPITASAAEKLMSELELFYRIHSYGRFQPNATVTPLLTLPSPKEVYFPVDENGAQSWGAYQILADAREVARRAGFDPNDYDFDMIRFNSPYRASWANVGFAGAWMVTSDPATTIHELGHNLGLRHSNLWHGPLNGNGSNSEYGDAFDVMGRAQLYMLAGLNTYRKASLGWLDQTNVRQITASGIYRLYAHDTDEIDAGRTYLLRIRKDDERDYWIEKRQNFIFSDDLEFTGVLAYWDEWPESNGGTHLLDPVGAAGLTIPIFEPLIDIVAGVRLIPLRQAEDLSYIDIAVFVGSARLNIVPGLLHFAGNANQSYTVQASTDLRSWSNIAQTNSVSGELFIPINTESTQNFYRIF